MRAAMIAAAGPSRDAAAAWRASPAWQAMAAAFEGAGDDPGPVADRCAALLGDTMWVRTLLAPLIDALAIAPLIQPPFRVTRDAVRIAASLFHCPAGSITATVTDARAMAALPPPDSVIFSGRVAVTRTVRSGDAVLRRWRREGEAAAIVAPLPLRDGAVHRIDGRCEATLLTGAEHDVVTLTASLAAGAAALMHEHAIADGALLRHAFADDRPARCETLLALLRTAGRADAGDCFDAATRDPRHALRWAAMREWLALDARTALPRLKAMTDDSHPEVRAAARRTLPLVEARCHG